MSNCIPNLSGVINLCKSLNLIKINGIECKIEEFRQFAYSFSQINLTTLNLQDCNISSDGGVFLARCIKNIPMLNTLNLSGNCLGKGIEELSNQFENLKILKFIDLSRNNLSSDSAVIFGLNLGHLNKIRFLILDSNQISDKGIIVISKQLTLITKLIVLSVSDNDISCIGANELGNNIKFLKKLQKLDISKNMIKSDGIKEIILGLNNQFSLKKLKLSGSQLNKTNFTLLKYQFERIYKDLQSLELNEVKFSNETLVELFDGTKYLNKLLKLEMQKCSINSFNLNFIGLYNLETLNLNSNNLGEIGIINLSNQIKYISCIKYLYLSDNNLYNDSMFKLVSKIDDLKNLSYFDLSSNYINDKCLDYLSAYFVNCKNSVEINLKNNKIVDVNRFQNSVKLIEKIIVNL